MVGTTNGDRRKMPKAVDTKAIVAASEADLTVPPFPTTNHRREKDRAGMKAECDKATNTVALIRARKPLQHPYTFCRMTNAIDVPDGWPNWELTKRYGPIFARLEAEIAEHMDLLNAEDARILERARTDNVRLNRMLGLYYSYNIQ